MRRSAGFALAALVLAVAAVPAGASTSATRPAGSPDLAAMALALHDLPAGAEVDREGYYRDADFVAAYSREFSLRGERIGRSRLLGISHDLGVERTAADAAASFRELRGLLRRRSFRRELARVLAEEAGAAPGAVTVTRPRTARIGDGAVSIMVGLKAGRTSFQASLTFVRVDRVLTILALVGAPQRKVYGADADRVARVAAERMPGASCRRLACCLWSPACSTRARPCRRRAARGRRPAHLHLPVGTLLGGHGAGDRLHGAPGCDLGQYVVTRGDLASRLRVVVTARNRLDIGFAALGADQRRRRASGCPGCIDATGNRRPRPDRVDGDCRPGCVDGLAGRVRVPVAPLQRVHRRLSGRRRSDRARVRGRAG